MCTLGSSTEQTKRPYVLKLVVLWKYSTVGGVGRAESWVKSRRLGEKGGRNSRKRRGWMGDGSARVAKRKIGAGVLLLLNFQVSEAVLVDFRDSNEGKDVLSVELLGCGDFGESLFIGELHHGDLLESLLI